MLRTTEALDHEWRADYEHSPQGTLALRRWARTEPALAGLADLGAVLARRRVPHHSGPVLAALARLAPGDRVAARTLLQALLPGLVHLALRRCPYDPDALEEVTALAWERIRTYPPSRPGSVAANVILDVRKRYQAHRAVTQPAGSHPALQAVPAPSAEDVAMERLTVDELVGAARRGVITGDALRVILRTRLGGVPLRHVAREGGQDERLLTCMRWRAERRLRAQMADVA